MTIQDYLGKVAYIAGSILIGDHKAKVYYSKYDQSYIGRVGMENDSLLKMLAVQGITEQLTHGVGFSTKDGKWYGWSHRAIHGFEVGSTCKKGDCHYQGSNLKDQEEDAILFWSDEHHLNTRCHGIMKENGDEFFDIRWVYAEDTPNIKLRNREGGALYYIKPLGRGEWVAKTMEDAKQMAIDFNEGVS